MNSPFFSIVLPTYNRADFISKAINSVILQTFKDWELIIIDDGSTDNTKELVSTFNNPGIKYFYQQNQERSVARNKGIEKSKGQYICFLDSDDYYLENHLLVLYEDISKGNSPIAFYYVLRAFENKGVVSFPENQAESNGNNLALIFKTIIAPPQACLHREILKIHRFDPRFFIAEDIELWTRILLEYPLYRVNTHTVVSIVHDENSISFSQGNCYAQNLIVFKHIFKNRQISKKIGFLKKQDIFSNCFFGIARYHLFMSQRPKAVFNLLISILYYPFHKQTKHKIYLISRTIFKIL